MLWGARPVLPRGLGFRHDLSMRLHSAPVLAPVVQSSHNPYHAHPDWLPWAGAVVISTAALSDGVGVGPLNSNKLQGDGSEHPKPAQ